MFKKFPSRLALMAAVAALCLVPVGAASAARGGPSPSATATLYSSCDPCTVGSVASLWGSGYDGSQGAAQLYVSGAAAAIPVNADGTVSFGWYMSAPGSYDFRIYQKGNGKNKLVMKGQLTVAAE